MTRAVALRAGAHAATKSVVKERAALRLKPVAAALYEARTRWDSRPLPIRPELLANSTARVRNAVFEISEPRSAAEVLVQQTRQRTIDAVKEQGLDVDGYLRAIRRIAQRDPTFARILEVFDTGAYTFAMDRSPSSRMRILESGFQNVYESGRSAGVADTSVRSFVEAQYLGMSAEEYRALAPSLRSKSTYLVPERETGIRAVPTVYFEDMDTGRYTGDTWIFDRPKVEPRTVALVGDSLNRAFFEGDLLDDIKNFIVAPNARLDPKRMTSYWLPTDWLAMSAPYFYERVRTRDEWRFTDPESPEMRARHEAFYADFAQDGLDIVPDWLLARVDLNKPEFNEQFFAKFPELAPYRDTFLASPHGNYVEGATFGALPVSDAKALIYRSNPPTDAERALFEARGIDLIDGTNEPPGTVYRRPPPAPAEPVE